MVQLKANHLTRKFFFNLKAEFSTVSKDIYKYIYMYLDTVEKLTGDLQITSSRLSIQPMNFLQRFNSNLYICNAWLEKCVVSQSASWLQASRRKDCRRLSIVEYPI